MRLLTGHLLLKGHGTALATEAVRLPADHLGHGGAPWNEHTTDRILDHLILAFRETLNSTLSAKFPNCAPDKKIQDDEEDENEDDSIHRGLRL